jgi:hypothetical protein
LPLVAARCRFFLALIYIMLRRGVLRINLAGTGMNAGEVNDTFYAV